MASMRNNPRPKRRILIFEKAEPLRTTAAKFLLRRIRYEIDEVADVAKALQILASDARDLAVLIVGMDDADGERVAAFARDTQPSLPIVGWAERPRPAASPCTAWVRRPSHMEDLLETIRSVLER